MGRTASIPNLGHRQMLNTSHPAVVSNGLQDVISTSRTNASGRYRPSGLLNLYAPLRADARRSASPWGRPRQAKVSGLGDFAHPATRCSIHRSKGHPPLTPSSRWNLLS